MTTTRKEMESIGESPVHTLLFALLTMKVPGVPLSWRKVHGGESMRWIGYQVDVAGLSLGMTESRAKWSVDWCSRLARDGRCRPDELRFGLGRFGLVTGIGVREAVLGSFVLFCFTLPRPSICDIAA